MGIDEDFALALAFSSDNENERSDIKENKQNAIINTRKILEPTSLADPSWELVDPTPDIFALFIAFDLRFFWGKLKSVVIRWSKRMYNCAGICSYAGRCGLCTISLSEPLLKLRPRKDLIETLLHEMIHAYLFVTHNNKDRSGHGPEFHKHMYRINGEAGVNITVYHSFHDEVNLYKTHWWRCNGSCRSKPPYFGTVKRAMNRAPGPSDFWWNQHQTSCGGTWEKIKEPETVRKKQVTNKGTSNIHGMNNITNFINKGNKGMTSNRSGTLVITKPPTKAVMTNTKPPTPKATQNLITNYISNSNNFKVNTPLISPANGNLVNVKGFKDFNVTPVKPMNVFTGSGKTLGSSSDLAGKQTIQSNLNLNAAKTVKNHWANKYSSSIAASSSDIAPRKRRKLTDGYIEIDNVDINREKNDVPHVIDVDFVDTTHKKVLISSPIVVIDDKSEKGNEISSDFNQKCHDMKVNCPNCGKSVYEKYLNEHLDSCLISGNNLKIVKPDFIIIDDAKPGNSKSSKSDLGPHEVKVQCPNCSKNVYEKHLNEHLDNCLENDSKNEVSLISKSGRNMNNTAQKSNINAENGNKQIDDFELKPHELKVNCPNCKKTVFDKCLNEHLDSCLRSSNDSDDDDVLLITEPIEDPIEIDDSEYETFLTSEFSGSDTMADDFLNKSREKPHYIKCPMCNKDIDSATLSEHLENCNEIIFSQSNMESSKLGDMDTINMLKQIGYSAEEISNYLTNTKKNGIDKASTSGTSSAKNLTNLVQNVDQDYFNESVNASFIGTQEIDEDENEDYLSDLSQNDEELSNNFPCPVCYESVSLEDMNSHLNSCLK